MIAFLDDDDEWEKDKLKLQLDFHEKNKAKISYTNEKWIRDGKQVNIPKKHQKHSGWIFEQCLSHCFIAPSSVLIDKKIFDEFGLFNEDLEVCEDYDMWLKIASKYPIYLLNKPLIKKYAGHKNQLSFKHWGMDRFRVKSLLNIKSLLQNERQVELLNMELRKKIEILKLGAKKHKNFQMLKHYERLTLLC